GVALEFNDDAAILVRLVAHRGDVRDDLLVDQRGDLFFEGGTVDVERNLGDDQLLAVALELFDADAAALLDAAAAGGEIILDALDAADHAAGRKIGALDEFHQFRDCDLRVVDLRANAV